MTSSILNLSKAVRAVCSPFLGISVWREPQHCTMPFRLRQSAIMVRHRNQQETQSLTEKRLRSMGQSPIIVTDAILSDASKMN